jgi:enterochelin esterase-like enzyme
MRLRILLLGLAIVGGIAIASYVESGRLHAPSTPEVARGSASLEDAVREIAAGTRTSPLVGDQPRRGMPTLTFLAKAEGKDVPRILSDATGWGERADGTMDYTVGKMTRVGQTSWYALETKVEPYARIEYLITYGAGDFRLDPHNPRKVMRVGGPASEVVLPGYMPPQEFVDPPTNDGGRLTDTMVESRVLGDAREVIVYTPPGYREDGAYPLAVFEDGALMVNSGEAPRVLNWLIAHQAIEPIVAVFVEPKSRAEDFRRGAPMQRFVANELLPWVAERYSVTKEANQRAIIGVSAGARAALNTATASTTSFGLVGLLIPALDEADIETVPPRDRQRLRVSIVAARYDALNRAAARSVQLNVGDQGHVADFIEVPEGHSTATWRTHLRTVLISLFGVQKPRT